MANMLDIDTHLLIELIWTSITFRTWIISYLCLNHEVITYPRRTSTAIIQTNIEIRVERSNDIS